MFGSEVYPGVSILVVLQPTGAGAVWPVDDELVLL
jgi:hypothetical protein